jgi:hypothetical protein
MADPGWRLAPGDMITRIPQRHIRCSQQFAGHLRQAGYCLYPVTHFVQFRGALK